MPQTPHVEQHFTAGEVVRAIVKGNDLVHAFALKAVRQVKDGSAVLDGIEVEILLGQITALVGRSGAGKTSLLRLLNRLDEPANGEIFYRSHPVTDYPVQELRRKVGFVFQTPVMFPGTVRDNLRVAAELAGQNGSDTDERIREAMAFAELDASLADRNGDRLSVGQKQRVNIARTLMTAPDVLLMDEPTSALDPETADRLMETVSRLSREQGLTVVMVTHRLAEARRASDRTVVMESGHIIASGASCDIFERSTNESVRAFLDSER